jgi:hypothetical protein
MNDRATLGDVFVSMYGPKNAEDALKLGEAYDSLITATDEVFDGLRTATRGLRSYAQATITMTRLAWRLRHAVRHDES